MSKATDIYFTAFNGESDNGCIFCEKAIGKPVMMDGKEIGKVVNTDGHAITCRLYHDCLDFKVPVPDETQLCIEIKEK